MLSAAILLTAMAAPAPPRELRDYLRRKDGTYAAIVRPEPGGAKIELTSQTWQGAPWRHTLLWREGRNVETKGVAILYITGDGPRPGDLAQLTLVEGAAKMPIAMLFDVPNQPLWGMKEDDLIAHTFAKYLETGDANWPLLFPMAKSAVRAMDAIQEATKNSDNPIKRFVVTGASKRGWTTWLAAASGDKRVAGIAPMVYDNLDLDAQMKRQMTIWGAYSEQIQEYTRRGLQAAMATPRGKALARMVDPWSYRRDLRVPTLVVTGANDPYWPTDATTLYWDGLAAPKSALAVPNAGHGLGSGIQAIETVTAFARAVAADRAFPTVEAQVRRWGDDVKALVAVPPVSFGKGGEAQVISSRLWIATADTTDFRPAKWEAVPFDPPKDGAAVAVQKAVPAGKKAAAYVELRFRDGDREFSLTSSPQVLP